jgi:hypothetical protein
LMLPSWSAMLQFSRDFPGKISFALLIPPPTTSAPF